MRRPVKEEIVRLRPGEVEAGGWHAVALTEVIERLRAATPEVSGRPRVIAIDGRVGAGKTMIIDRPGAITVPAGLEIVWVEGTGIIREECAAWIDALLYLQGDLDVQDRRLEARDGTSPEQLQQIER